MITKENKFKLIQIIGKHYSKKVATFLEHKGLINKEGRPHSESMIRSVMNGEKSHDEIEKGIYEFAANKKSELTKERKRRENLLETWDQLGTDISKIKNP